MRSTWKGALIVGILALAPGVARGQAESEKKAVASALFDEARALMVSGDYEKACAKFDASLKMVSQLGTRLNLGSCYEKIGRLASAWAEYREAASMAARASDARETVAREAVALLEPRLSRITIKLAARASVLEMRVTRDGVVVVPAILDSAVPVDPGTHVVAATAPGYKPWETKVVVGPAEDLVTVEVPELEKLPDAPTVVVSQGTSPGQIPGAEPGDPGRTRKLIALGVGGGGIALVGTGLVFGLRASSRWSDAKDHGCNSDGDCTTRQGLDEYRSARSAGTVATVLTIAGGVGVAAGVVLYLTAPSARRADRTALRLEPLVGPGLLGVAAGGEL